MRPLTLLSCLPLLVIGLVVRADPLRFEGTATILPVIDHLGVEPIPDEGAELSFNYQLDSSTSDLDEDSNSGLYLDLEPGASIRAEVPADSGAGSLVFDCSGLSVLVTNGPSVDDYSASAPLPPFPDDCRVSSGGSVLGGLDVRPLFLFLEDSTGTALPDDSLPTDLRIEDWDFTAILIEACPQVNPSCIPESEGFSLLAVVTMVPEPSGGAVSALGLAGVIVLAQMRKRSALWRSP